jgi:ParB/RepB/Spo0J family partition protein
MQFKMIPKRNIEPSEWNPRKSWDEEKLQQLKTTIQGIGLIEPIVVRPKPDNSGKFFISAGESRWNQFTDNQLIPCIIRDENELDAKITSLIENYVRENVSDVDHERFIAEIYDEGVKEKKWSSYSEMENKTGIRNEEISLCVLAFQDRSQFEDSRKEKSSTSDIIESRPLKEKPELRSKLLKQRADGKIKGSGHIVREYAKTLSRIPEPVAEAILDEKIDYQDVKDRVDMLGGEQIPIHVAQELVEKLADEKTKIKIDKKLSAEMDAISIKEKEPAEKQIKFDKSTDEKRLEVWEKRYRQFEMMTIHDVNIIKNGKCRTQAITYLKKIRDKCSQLLRELNEDIVIKK